MQPAPCCIAYGSCGCAAAQADARAVGLGSAFASALASSSAKSVQQCLAGQTTQATGDQPCKCKPSADALLVHLL